MIISYRKTSIAAAAVLAPAYAYVAAPERRIARP